MSNVATAFLTIAAAAWVGAIVFQSAVVAPSVFACLGESDARRLLRGLFPRFFRLGLVLGAVMLTALAGISAARGFSPALALVAGAASLMVLLQAASMRMVPHINAARDAGATAKFARLHRLSVLLTVLVLILGIGILSVIGSGSDLAAGGS